MPEKNPAVESDLLFMRQFHHEWPVKPVETTSILKKPGKRKPGLGYYDRKIDNKSIAIRGYKSSLYRMEIGLR